MRATKYAYIGQFGAIWRLPLLQWRKLCEQAAQGLGYDLDAWRPLKSRPAWLLCDGSPECFYKTRNDRIYHEPLDWFEDDYEDAVGEIDEFLAEQEAQPPQRPARRKPKAAARPISTKIARLQNS